MANFQPIEKIYSLKTTGYGDVLNNLSSLTKAFAQIRAEKEKLNALSSKIEDPAQLAKINTELQTLAVREKDVSEQIKNNLVVKDKLVKLEKMQTDGTTKGVSAYMKLIAAYKESKVAMEEIAAEFGDQSNQALKAAAAFKIYKDQVLAIRNLGKSGGAAPSETPVVISTTNVGDIEAEQNRASSATGTVQSPHDSQEVEDLQAANAYYAAKKEGSAIVKEATVAEQAELTTLQQLAETMVVEQAEMERLNLAIKENKAAFDAGTISEEKYLASATLLTEEQSIQKVVLSEARIALSQATKEQLAAETSMKQMGVQLGLLRQQYRDLTEAERQSAAGLEMIGKITKLDAEIKVLDTSIGNSQRNVGNYSGAISKAFGRFTSFDSIIGKLISNIGRMGIHFLAFSLIIKGVEFLVEKISEAFDKMSGKFDKAAVASKGLQDALADDTYKTAVTNVQRLGVEVDLASKGLYSQKEALDDYNKSLGAALGTANSFADVEAKLADKDRVDAYVKAMLYRAAAASILKDASEALAKAAMEDQKDVDVQKSPQGKVIFGRTGLKKNADGTYSESKTTAAD